MLKRSFGDPTFEVLEPGGGTAQEIEHDMTTSTGGPSASPWTLQRSEVLAGTYRVVRRLAVGGMGEVYLCRHVRLPGFFVAKVLTRDFQDSAESVVRFRREAEMLASLRHPNIVQVFDFNITDNGLPFLVMEYLEGQELGRLLRSNKPMSRLQAVHIVRQVAAALETAHTAGIVHRDLKPENVVLIRAPGQENFVKVIDFGISLSPGTRRLTANEVLMGTPHFMSPEQAQGRRESVDPKSDQFSLASLAYLMLTGRMPFDGPEPLAVLYSVVHQAPAPVEPVLGSGVEAVLLRALSKAKEDRFASIIGFATALEAAIFESAGVLTDPALPSLTSAQTSGEAGEAKQKPLLLKKPSKKTQSGNTVKIEPELHRWNVMGAVTLGMAVVGVVGFVALDHFHLSLNQVAAAVATHTSSWAAWLTRQW